MYCLLDSLTPLGLASLQKQWHFTEEWMGKKDNQSIFHNGSWRKPKSVHLCPINNWTTRTNQHHPTDLNQVTAAQSEDSGQQGRAFKQITKCRGFLFMCSVIPCSADLIELFAGELLCSLPETLPWSWTFPFWMAPPWRLLLGGGQWWVPDLKQQNSTLTWSCSCLQSNTATCEGQGLQHSWDKSSFVLTTHSKPERQGECPRVSGKGLQHPCPAFWLPLRTCWQSHPPTVCFSLALAVTPPVTTLWSPSTFPLHSWHNPTLWGHIPSISAAHFSAPSPARQQGFFKGYILEIATVSNY